MGRFYKLFKSDAFRQKKSPGDKSSYLQNRAGGVTIIQEAFQYPTRLGRTAYLPGGSFLCAGDVPAPPGGPRFFRSGADRAGG